MLDLVRLHKHIQALDEGDEAARRQAIQSLKLYEGQEWATAPAKVIHSLVTSLQTQLLSRRKVPSIRQDLATILGNVGRRAEPAIPQLLELLQEEVPDGIREAAATALAKIGQDATGTIQYRLQTALVNLWLSSPQSQKSQVQVALALCKLNIEAKGLVRFLTSTLVAGQDTSRRKCVAAALAWCNKNEVDVVPALLAAALDDKDEEVRQRAAAGLDQLRLSHDKAIHLCTKQLKESSYAETALRKSGQPAVAALIEVLRTAESTTRAKAARILGSFGELAVDAVPALTAALHDEDLDVRLAAAKGLWNVTKNADVVVPVLVDLLKDKWAAAFEVEESRRRFLQSVLESLGRIGPPAKAAVSTLSTIAKHKNRHISESAVYALRQIAPAVTNKAERVRTGWQPLAGRPSKTKA
jgi:HEAT repeat protein